MADEIKLSDASLEDEYEEISSEEVDRIVIALEDLMESVASENIRAYLEDALNSIYYLVYDDEEEEEDGQTAQAA